MTIDDLLDIESIKHLRALGSKYLDSGDLEALVDLYTEDAVCELGPTAPGTAATPSLPTSPRPRLRSTRAATFPTCTS